MTRFIGEDGRVPEWLEFLESGNPMIAPDKAGAMQVLVAATLDDPDEMARALERILRERPAVPLMSGLIHFGLVFGRVIYGDHRDDAFRVAALGYSVNEETTE